LPNVVVWFCICIFGSKILVVQFLAIENMGFLIVGKREMTIYNFLNSVKDKLQLLLNNNAK